MNSISSVMSAIFCRQDKLEILSGEEFNRYCSEKNLHLYKILRGDLCHHNFCYNVGLNTLKDTFHPYGDCEWGGLYFCDHINVFHWLKLGTIIADVTIPDGAQVCLQKFGKYKCDQMIISNLRKIDQSVIKMLVSSGSDIHVANEHALLCALFDADYFRIKWLTEEGSDVNKMDHRELCSALRYLYNKGKQHCAVSKVFETACAEQNEKLRQKEESEKKE